MSSRNREFDQVDGTRSNNSLWVMACPMCLQCFLFKICDICVPHVQGRPESVPSQLLNQMCINCTRRLGSETEVSRCPNC